MDVGNGTWASAGTVSSNLQGSSCFCRPGEFFLSIFRCSDWVISIILSSHSLILLSHSAVEPIHWDISITLTLGVCALCAHVCACVHVVHARGPMRLTSDVSLSYSLPYVLWQGLSLEPTTY